MIKSLIATTVALGTIVTGAITFAPKADAACAVFAGAPTCVAFGRYYDNLTINGPRGLEYAKIRCTRTRISYNSTGPNTKAFMRAFTSRWCAAR